MRHFAPATRTYPSICALFIAGAALLPTAASGADGGWWIEEPVRLVQTNLRETDATLDPARLIGQVKEYPANALLFGMGGIVCYYPTQTAFHYPSVHLPAGTDLFGDVLQLAHAQRIRVIGRFDLSKTQKAVWEAHPEWFFKRADGAPAIYSGLYSTCINGGYYRGQALAILREALTRYDVDGLFFNMFGNPSSDYSGRSLGPCHCASCQERFQAAYGRSIPASPDAEYRAFMSRSTQEVAAEIAALIHQIRPRAAFLTYLQRHTDGIMSESNTGVNRPLPMWPYSASENVNRARTSEPGKMAFNLCMSFVDFPWRFAHVPQPEIQLRLYQNMAHGAGPALTVLGTFEQEDRTSLLAGRPAFQWHAAHEDIYVKQASAAKVLLLPGPQANFRGLFRILTERHIPFAISDNPRPWESGPYELVVCGGPLPDGADEYVRKGGRLLVTGTSPPPFFPPPVQRHEPTQAYWRIHGAALPSMAHRRVIWFDSAWLEYAPQKNWLTLVPPAMFGPPEKVWTDKKETSVPGLMWAEVENGRVAYLPWDIGALYLRHSAEGHADLISDLVDLLLPAGRQVATSAHPAVEITLMRQSHRHRLLLHLVNGSGHSGTAYFPPLPIREIPLTIREPFTRARSIALGRDLAVTREGATGEFMLPELRAYDVVVLE